jgi:hypothetical protein
MSADAVLRKESLRFENMRIGINFRIAMSRENIEYD